MVHQNKRTSKRTMECLPGESVFSLWTNKLYWIWARGVHSGAFVTIVVSQRGCFMRYSDEIAKNPDISKDELKDLHRSVLNEAERNYPDDVEIHGARAYIIGPTPEQDSANKGDQGTRPETQAEFKTFDESEEANASASSSSSSSSDPEANTIEVYLDPEVSDLPIIYINGKKQSYTASEKILHWND